MKKLITVIMILFMLTLGCATKNINPNYLAYTQTLQAQFVASQEPLVQIQVDLEGKISGIVINQPTRPIHVEQKKESAGWRVASNAIKMLGIVGSIFMVGQALEGIVDSSGNTSYVNSHNNNSANTGSIDQAYSISTDTNTATETITTTGVE